MFYLSECEVTLKDMGTIDPYQSITNTINNETLGQTLHTVLCKFCGVKLLILFDQMIPIARPYLFVYT